MGHKLDKIRDTFRFLRENSNSALTKKKNFEEYKRISEEQSEYSAFKFYTMNRLADELDMYSKVIIELNNKFLENFNILREEFSFKSQFECVELGNDRYQITKKHLD